jgi:thiamine transport system substrate-binding protein
MLRPAALTLILLTLWLTPQALAQRVVLMTHDSFDISRSVLEAFTADTGITVELLKAGDAGEALNRAALTAARPIADVLFGIDEGLFARALELGIFEPYRSPELAAVDPRFSFASNHLVTPLTAGFVAFNLDRASFEQQGIPFPTSLAQLLEPRYGSLTVVTDPATSSPGLSLLLGTIGAWGEEAAFTWWAGLRDAGVVVRSGWSSAYYGDFSRHGGDRPIVLSYASSPAAEVIFAAESIDPTAPPTLSLNCDQCVVQQIETAGILAGTPRRAEAEALIDFLLSESFQADVPASMFVYPTRAGITLPAEFDSYGPIPPPSSLMPLPTNLSGEQINAWIARWSEVMLRGR